MSTKAKYLRPQIIFSPKERRSLYHIFQNMFLRTCVCMSQLKKKKKKKNTTCNQMNLKDTGLNRIKLVSLL